MHYAIFSSMLERPFTVRKRFISNRPTLAKKSSFSTFFSISKPSVYGLNFSHPRPGNCYKNVSARCISCAPRGNPCKGAGTTDTLLDGRFDNMPWYTGYRLVIWSGSDGNQHLCFCNSGLFCRSLLCIRVRQRSTAQTPCRSRLSWPYWLLFAVISPLYCSNQATWKYKSAVRNASDRAFCILYG